MEHKRRIRSYVLRAGRMTDGQTRAWQELFPRYGVEFTQRPLDLDAIFGRHSPRVLEIGFGSGEVIGQLAKDNPQTDYLGIEVHRPGVGRLLQYCAAENLGNLRIICHDAVEVLEHGIADAALEEILVFFPDPWHKKRHHKRRLVDPGFMALLAQRLRSGGIIRLATDWQDYALQMLASGNTCPALESLSPDGGFVEHYQGRSSTRFEQRGARLGHGIRDLAYRRR